MNSNNITVRVAHLVSYNNIMLGQAIAWYVFDTHNIPESGFNPTFRYI